MNKESEIISLPKEKWKGTPIPITTKSDSYYDFEIDPLNQAGDVFALFRFMGAKNALFLTFECKYCIIKI